MGEQDKTGGDQAAKTTPAKKAAASKPVSTDTGRQQGQVAPHVTELPHLAQSHGAYPTPVAQAADDKLGTDEAARQAAAAAAAEKDSGKGSSRKTDDAWREGAPAPADKFVELDPADPAGDGKLVDKAPKGYGRQIAVAGAPLSRVAAERIARG